MLAEVTAKGCPFVPSAIGAWSNTLTALIEETISEIQQSDLTLSSLDPPAAANFESDPAGGSIWTTMADLEKSMGAHALWELSAVSLPLHLAFWCYTSLNASI